MRAQAFRRPYYAKMWSAIIATTIFITVGFVLTGMMTYVVSSMTASANALDNERATRAAATALTGFAAKLNATVRDNAVWDDAYTALSSQRAAEWAYENWGKTSKDYPLYDGAIVVGPKGEIISAYDKGDVFDPEPHFGEQFRRQTTAAAARRVPDPLFAFFQTNAGIAVLSAGTVQPFSSASRDDRHSVLTFYKYLTSAELSAMGTVHGLVDLRIDATNSPDRLSIRITDMDGHTIGYLTWLSRAPGTQIYNEVSPVIVIASALIALLLGGALLTGIVETRQLGELVRCARWDAAHDGLSGLYNRTGLLNELGSLLDEGPKSTKLVLHLIDLDGFKSVNDTWGHAIGDEIISVIGNTIAFCHPELVLAARLGGDEFALVQAGETDCHDFAQELFGVLDQPIVVGERTIKVGASIGVAGANDAIDALELLRRADMALYEAKAIGKGCCVQYEPALDRNRQLAQNLEADLKQAIEQDLIDVVFQPLVSAQTGEIQGVEALARWQNGQSNISPDVFIALAEKSGLIDRLGALMLKRSIQAARHWDKINLSVNVSPAQLRNPNFAADVIAILEEEKFAPNRLTLEITEGVLLSDPEQAHRAMGVLGAAGLKFALDDFGSGYASIGALRSFKFDRMKIDRSLVWAVDSNGEEGKNVLLATISLAKALNMPVTAEGIETKAQAEILRAAGCEQLQGYLFAKPMPKAGIDAALINMSGGIRLTKTEFAAPLP